ncbi:DUF5133 domain-containing protein [Streptomyces sp. Lzd4kr]|nr:DUF5133 domain-containing protein [Streptomyces sp. Lzd4kr]
MILWAEKALNVALARFAEARIEHDVRPTGRTVRALADATYTLCAITGYRTAGQALIAADALMQRYRDDRTRIPDKDEPLVV